MGGGEGVGTISGDGGVTGTLASPSVCRNLCQKVLSSSSSLSLPDRLLAKASGKVDEMRRLAIARRARRENVIFVFVS